MSRTPSKFRDVKAEQRVRINRFLLAMVTYLFSYLASIIVVYIGGADAPIGFWWKALFIMCVINAAFTYLFFSGNNLKFSDPSLTSLQIVVSSVLGYYILHAIPIARPYVLMFFIPPFCFGMLKLKPNQFRQTTIWVLALYTLLLMYESYTRPQFNLNQEIITFSLFGALLVWFSWFGGVVSRIRSELKLRTHQLEEANQIIVEQSITDELTQVYNRRHAVTVLKHVIGIADRFDLPFSVAMIDIDHFKRINDEHGHLVGDAVLKLFAQRASEAIRLADMLVTTVWHEPEAMLESASVSDSGFIARYGGEEFLVLLPGTILENARIAMERVQHLVCNEAFDVPFPIAVTFSVGLAQFNKGEAIENLLNRADTALYNAKHNGRNRVETIG